MRPGGLDCGHSDLRDRRLLRRFQGTAQHHGLFVLELIVELVASGGLFAVLVFGGLTLVLLRECRGGTVLIQLIVLAGSAVGRRRVEWCIEPGRQYVGCR